MPEASPFLNSTLSVNHLTTPEPSLSLLPTKSLVTPRRLDLAVKYRFFRHLLSGNDADSERVYRWHIEKRSGARMRAGLATDQWKLTVEHYVQSARYLYASISCGVPMSAVPIDPDGELLDGSHRVACAIALGVDAMPVAHMSRHVWAPAWGYDWFVANGMADEDLARLQADYRAMTA